MKKFLKTTLSLVLAFALSVPALAADAAFSYPPDNWMSVDINTEIARALNGETDLISTEAPAAASAVVLDENGNEQSVPVDVYLTTRRLVPPQNVATMSVERFDNVEEPVYATTAVAVMASEKSDTNTGTQEYVTGTLTIFWRDVLGTSNEFMGLSGGWTVAKNPETGERATLSNRYVGLQGGSSASSKGDVYRIYPTSNSFEVSDSEYEDGWWAYEAQSEVKINNSVWLVVEVSTGMIVIG